MSSKIDFKQHWNNAYSAKPINKMGWYENDVSATFRLIDNAIIDKDARILNVGAGSTTLVDELLAKGYANVIASDISEVSLTVLKARLGVKSAEIDWIVDDLINSTKLKNLDTVNLWIDRAVLHFFTKQADRKAYFELLKQLVKSDGYVIFAEFNLDGALKCSGLDVHRYSNQLLMDDLGSSFKLIDTFDHIYTMPSGDLRPYIYSLFKRQV